MSRFFLHIFNDSVSMDEEGEVADDLLAARTIALNGARELLCEQIKRGYLNLDNYIVVAEDRTRAFTCPFRRSVSRPPAAHTGGSVTPLRFTIDFARWDPLRAKAGN